MRDARPSPHTGWLADTPPAPDPRRWRILAACMTTLFLTLVDATIVNVALPSIGDGLHASRSQLQWVVSGYALSFGMVPILGGRLGDDRGRRRMLLLGISGFIASSAAVGLAPSARVLIAARLVQGLAGGLVNPQVSGIVQTMFRGAERARAFGLQGAVVGISTAAGPLLGGAVIAAGGPRWGWRATFLLNVPIGAASALLCRRWLPARPPRSEGSSARRLDLPGLGLLALGLFGVLYPTVEFDSSRDPRLAVLLVPAAAVLAAFVAWERGPGRRRGYPLIDTRLFAIRSYSAGLLLALVYFCSYTGLPLVLSLFLQNGLGFSPLQAGATAGSFAVGAACSAPVAGRLLPRLGRRLLVGSLSLFVVGITGIAVVADMVAGRVGTGTLGGLLALPLLIAGLGGGGVITPNQALSFADVDSRGGSTAGGMLQTSQRVGSAIGTAGLSAVFYAAVSGIVAAGGPAAGGAGAAARDAAYGHAFAITLLATLALAVLALAIAVREARRSPRPGAADTRLSRG